MSDQIITPTPIPTTEQIPLRIMIINSSAIPSPPPNNSYGGLELITHELMSEFIRYSGLEIYFITTKNSQLKEGVYNTTDKDGNPVSKLKVYHTVDPTWYGDNEYNHFLAYKDIIIKDFADYPKHVIFDHTWALWSYKLKLRYPKLNIMHTHHGMLGFNNTLGTLIDYHRFTGLSTTHAHYMSTQLGIPVRYIHNGISPEKNNILEKEKETIINPENFKDSYLLSLNRITDEKGIKECVDVAMATGNKIIIAGDDTHTNNQYYINEVIETCRNSNGKAVYMGLVDYNTKINLIKNSKALIACPRTTWVEAFGLYAIEANAYYKPIVATSNGGLNDIIINGANGFIATNPESLKPYIEKIPEINPDNCRRVFEQRFTSFIMAQNYLSYANGIASGDDKFKW